MSVTTRVTFILLLLLTSCVSRHQVVGPGYSYTRVAPNTYVVLARSDVHMDRVRAELCGICTETYVGETWVIEVLK